MHSSTLIYLPLLILASGLPSSVLASPWLGGGDDCKDSWGWRRWDKTTCTSTIPAKTSKECTTETPQPIKTTPTVIPITTTSIPPPISETQTTSVVVTSTAPCDCSETTSVPVVTPITSIAKSTTLQTTTAPFPITSVKSSQTVKPSSVGTTSSVATSSSAVFTGAAAGFRAQGHEAWGLGAGLGVVGLVFAL